MLAEATEREASIIIVCWFAGCCKKEGTLQALRELRF